jgi:signal transduction histidine kinase
VSSTRTWIWRRSSGRRREDAALAEFARVIAHDLTEPLWTASLYAQALNDYGAELGADGREMLAQLMRTLAWMQERVRELALEAQTPGTLFERDVVDTRAAVLDALDVLGESVRRAGASCEIGPLPSVVGDRARISSLFQNLISNAIEHARAGTPPVISISASREGTHWHFEAADNGLGMAAEDNQRILEAFQRPAGGGLAACREIVELHGGRIWATSHDGPGTTLHFTLPSAR